MTNEERDFLVPEILEYMDNGIIVYEVIEKGEDFIIKYINNAAERLDNIDKKHLIGNSILKLYPKIKEIDLYNIIKRVWEQGIAEHHLIPLYNGKLLELWRDFHIFKLSGEYMVTTFDDVTEKELAEKQLRDAFDRSEFYRDLLVHDIKNIIQILFLYSENALSNLENKDLIQNYFEKILEQGKKADRLISNVDILFKLEKDHQELKRVELYEIITDSIKHIKESFSNKKIEIKVQSPETKLYIKANELLQEVFDNILNNAVKYNKNSIIKISIQIIKEVIDEISYIRLEFIDNGIGILDQNKEKIFERYYKVDKRASGMGLGLSLVRNLLESYEGKIWVQDRISGDYSKGSKFIILIPET